MKKKLTSFIILTVLLFSVSSILATAGNSSKDSNTSSLQKQSTIYVQGLTSYKKNLQNVPTKGNVTAGTFYGTRDSQTINFFCIDLEHYIEYTNYVDAGPTSLEITFILNNYYPFAGRQFSSILSEAEEAAATQLAIWHFSDNLGDISGVTPSNISAAAQVIINDANANAVAPNKEIVINFPEQNYIIGENVEFLVEVYDEYNAPVEGVTVTLSVDNGSLSTYSAVTNATGVTETIYLTQAPGENSATVTAKADVMISQGTKFVHYQLPDDKQKLVLATPFLDEVEISSGVNWFGQPNLSILKTGSTQTVSDGDQVVYTITVTNNASASAIATGVLVTDYLPGILTFVSADGAYYPNTGIWNVGDLAVGESKTLTITCTVDYASNGGSVYDLGPAADYNLFVLNNFTDTSGDVEGKMAVGKDATMGGYSVGDKLPANSGDVLIANRKLTFTSGRVYNGDAVYGSFVDTTHANLADGIIRKEKNLIDFSAAGAYLKNLSKQLYALTPTGTSIYDGYSTLTLTGTNTDVNVFEVDGSLISTAINAVQMTIPDGSLAIVNYTGKSLELSGGFDLILTQNGVAVDTLTGAGETADLNSDMPSKILLNFYKATNIKIQWMGILGSLLAPKADLNFESGVIYGQVMVKNYYGGFGDQVNWVPYTGQITLDTTITNVAEILSYNSISSQISEINGQNFSISRMMTSFITGVEDKTGMNDMPEEFELKQNYPNPFNPSTTINFAVPANGFYSVKIFNMLGQEVKTLVADELNAGYHTIDFNAAGLSSGIYFYRLSGPSVNMTKKMILMK